MGSDRKIGLKICGMREAKNIAQVSLFRPAYLGFIMYFKSPRFVGEDFRMPQEIPSVIKKVGVFVNETTERIHQSSAIMGFDYVQLHGNEPVDQVMELKDLGIKVIKVFSVDDRFDFKMTKPFVPVADYFLFDTKGRYFGGNAKTFNWDLLKHYDQEVPFFLSGGLSPENIAAVSTLEYMNIHAIDVNSGVEDAPGIKNTEKIKMLLDNLNA